MKWLYIVGVVVVALLAVEELLLRTAPWRRRRQLEAMSRAAPLSLRDRVARALAMPMFLLLVAVAVAAGMIAGVLAGTH